MGHEGVARALRLINEEGWGFTQEEIARMVRLDPHGSLVCVDGDQLLGVVTCVSYGRTGAIGHLVVAKEARRRRIGQTLLDHALRHCDASGCSSVVLYATEQGLGLYLKNGFNMRREGFCHHSWIRAKDLGDRDNPCRPLTEDDLREVSSLDREVFGDDRSEVMPWLMREFPGHGYKLVRGGRIVGYAMGQKTTDGYNLGPFVCVTGDEDAELLFRAVLRSIGEDHLYLCGFQENQGALRMMATLDPIRSWKVKFMVRGEDRYPRGVGKVYGVVSFEIG